MLLWVDMCCGAHGAAPSAEFSRHCQVRPTDQQHLWAALSLASDADVICFDVAPYILVSKLKRDFDFLKRFSNYF